MKVKISELKNNPGIFSFQPKTTVFLSIKHPFYVTLI